MRKADWESDPWAEEPASRRRWYDAIGTPGWAFNTIAGLLALAVLYFTATPGWEVVPLIGVGFAVFVLGIVWLVRLLAAAVRRGQGGSGEFMERFAVAPLILLLAATLVPFDVPVRIGFELSRAQFDRKVAEMRNDPAISERLEVDGWAGLAHRAERVGIYDVGSVTIDEESVAFDTGGGFFMFEGGFVYSPDGEPFVDHPYARDVTVLGGGWYSYVLEWD